MTAEHEMVRQKSDEKKRTDCQNELFYSQEYDTNRSKYLWQIILSMMQADPTPFIRFDSCMIVVELIILFVNLNFV